MGRSPKAATSGASGRHTSSWRAAGILLVALLALVGSGMIVAALTTEPAGPPQPPPAAAPESLAPMPNITPEPGLTKAPVDTPAPEDRSQPDGTAAGSPSPTTAPASMGRSRPTAVRIPRIGVNAHIMDIGIDASGAVEVPPLEQAQRAGWYKLGPTPGEVGNAVVVGHVDSHATGPAVFFELGALRPGDIIEVSREDGSVARFVVDGVVSYPREDFPTELVYGPSDRAGLRLITCGGKYDRKTNKYPNNVVVFATLEPGSRA